jgi:Na+-transporting NADH:ubiquinone oxidoreductase subunit NqrC
MNKIQNYKDQIIIIIIIIIIMCLYIYVFVWVSYLALRPSAAQGCAVGTQNLRLRHLQKSSICINNGKPTKMVNGIIRHFITTT